MISPERYQRVVDLFEQACRLSAEERPGFLKEACGPDAELQHEIESLLEHDSEGDADDGLLGQGKGMGLLASDLRADEPSGEELPRQIGGYRIIRQIGYGGMGAVYEAEQENPKRRVALKMVRPGLGEGQFTERLHRESQVLGLLQHPGIAHIYESGTVAVDGRRQPFFAMEFINGERITMHANNRGFDIRQRLELVARVCDAVQHAHQKGVIHRDLKPPNILVVEAETGTSGSSAARLIDEIGQPKVLDFGVARVSDNDLQLTTLQTSVGQLVGTFAYMSPEQIAGDAARLDTRCDIYALGIVLWQLLTGRLPFDLTGRSMAEVARMIRDDSPPRLGSIDARLRGDVETIVSKAIAKEPQQRYASATEMAADLRRFINDQPIMARPANAMYHLRKFARRNRALVAALSLALFTLVAGLATTVALLVTVTNERDAKQAALEASEAVTAFFTDMLEDATPEAAGKDVTVREMADASRREIQERFGDRPLLEARIRHTMGLMYLSLGELELAGEQLNGALAIWEASPEAERADILRTRYGLARVGFYNDDHEGVVRQIDAMLADVDESETESVSRGEALSLRALAVNRLGRLEEAASDLREAIRLLQAEHGPDASEVLDVKSVLAEHLSVAGHEDAEAFYLDLIERSIAVRGDEHPETLLLMANLGTHYRATRQTAKAVSMLQRVYAGQLRVLGAAHRQTLLTVNNLSRSLAKTGEIDAALAMVDKGLAQSNAAHGETSPSTVFLTYARSRILQKTDDHEATEKALLESVELYRRVQGPDAAGTWYAELDLLNFYGRQDRHDAAIELGQQMLSTLESKSMGGLRLAETQFFLARIYLHAGLYAQAEPLLLKAVSAVDAKPAMRAGARKALAMLYDAWGKPEQAEQWRSGP